MHAFGSLIIRFCPDLLMRFCPGVMMLLCEFVLEASLYNLFLYYMYIPEAKGCTVLSCQNFCEKSLYPAWSTILNLLIFPRKGMRIVTNESTFKFLQCFIKAYAMKIAQCDHKVYPLGRNCCLTEAFS